MKEKRLQNIKRIVLEVKTTAVLCIVIDCMSVFTGIFVILLINEYKIVSIIKLKQKYRRIIQNNFIGYFFLT